MFGKQLVNMSDAIKPMNQLNSTSFMSNRDRQIVASCLVNEVELDWRYRRKRFIVLVDDDNKPEGGKWNYDQQNSNKLKKRISPQSPHH